MARGDTATARSSTTASSSPNSSHISLPGSLSNALSWTLHRWNSSSSTSAESASSSFWGGGSGSRQNGRQHDGPLSSARSYPSSRPPSAGSRHRIYQPPPLPPITLTGYAANTTTRLLSTPIAEEVRQLLPPRLQLHDRWSLVYSLEQHGVSLATLYDKCAMREFQKGGFVLVVKDDGGGIFGAFVNERFKVSGGRYYGTGECFLWKASYVDIAQRTAQPKHNDNLLLDSSDEEYETQTSTSTSPTSMASSTVHLPRPPQPEPTLTFKAFPYSGVNDYMILCEQGFLSVGGGDSKYGLWLDNIFEKGVSSTCATFGNEPLSDEGEKFEIIGVEVWSVGGGAL
ncbi:hypothetical protein DFH27DRAFT_484982 [Peziza echinospora]|nr:hypothetical protein DFH27DRAFT_484982 [Peziza echinospora]